MNGLLIKSKSFLNRNASTILTYVGAAGTIATTVSAVRATPKAMALLEQAENEKGDKLTALEKFQVAGPVYIPSFLFGVSTLACIFGANALNKRQQAALMSAYALVNNSYNEYKEKTNELYGEDANERIVTEIAKGKYEGTDFGLDENVELFYDEFSGRYFQSTLYKVQAAEYRVNRELIMRDYVAVNEFYEWLDIPPIDAGDSIGWSKGGNFASAWQEWIDFTHMKVVMDDGLECHIVTMLVEPMPDFQDYW